MKTHHQLVMRTLLLPILTFQVQQIIIPQYLPVPIHNDEIGERTGQIEVSLLEDDVIEKTYKIANDGSQTVRATILDDDAPELKISAGNSVTEGDGNAANFTVTSEIQVTSLRVFYTPTSDNFIESGSGTKTFNTLNFSGEGPYTAPLPISVHDDSESEDNGTISVTLNEESSPGSTYTVANSPDHSATVTIIDDESLPYLSISAPTTSISEGFETADFVISTTANLGTDFRVRYSPAEVGTGNFLNENAPTSQEIPNSLLIDFTGSTNSYTATLPVPIHNDLVGESTGEIEVTLLPDDANAQTYQVRTDGTQIAKATIYDDDTPELKISASGTLTEGDGNNADFTITSEVLIASKTIFYTPVWCEFSGKWFWCQNICNSQLYW